MSRFRLTLIAPIELSVQTFDNVPDIWLETDSDKNESSLYVTDPSRESVMQIKGVPWLLGAGYTLGGGLFLDDSPEGKNEGVYYDFVVTPEVIYAFSCIYKVSLGECNLVFWDQTNDVKIDTVVLDGNSWQSYEASITIPALCTSVRISFLQSDDAHSGPYYIDNVSFSGNVILIDPDAYSRIPVRLGAFHQTLGGRKVFDLRAIHYDLKLIWNYIDEIQYENLRKVFFSNELLYFNDGNVPALTEVETIYDNDIYNYSGVTHPSGTHLAYVDSSALLPALKADFETTEYEDEDYNEITVYEEGDLGVEIKDPTAGNYLYQKFCLLSDILYTDVKRFGVRIVGSCDDSSLNNLDGCILYAWDGSTWMELTRSSNSEINTLSYSTAESLIASRFVDVDDGYVRLLLRSVASRNGISGLSFKVFSVEVEINEDLDSIIELSHKAILDDNGDVISVKNLTNGATLEFDTDYTLSIDRRSITVIGQDSGDIIEVKYNRYFEVMFSSIPEEWLSGDPDSNRTRRVEIALHTLSESK